MEPARCDQGARATEHNGAVMRQGDRATATRRGSRAVDVAANAIWLQRISLSKNCRDKKILSRPRYELNTQSVSRGHIVVFLAPMLGKSEHVTLRVVTSPAEEVFNSTVAAELLEWAKLFNSGRIKQSVTADNKKAPLAGLPGTGRDRGQQFSARQAQL